MNCKFYIKNCEFGKGIFASFDIKEGEEILRFKGNLINFQESLTKGERSGDPLQINKDVYIDTEKPGVYVNHSCEPNAGLKNDIILVAIKTIIKDEQIFYDYSTTMDEDYWTMKCDCTSKNCRGIIIDFKYLSEDLKEHYLHLGIVQSFIPKQYLTIKNLKDN